MIRSTVAIFRLPWSTEHHKIREDWFQDREEVFVYHSTKEGEQAAEEAFHITNAPDECLDDNQKAILKINQFKGPSLSVGDVVKVTTYPRNPDDLPKYYLCKSFGWEEFVGDRIQLLRHMSW